MIVSSHQIVLNLNLDIHAVALLKVPACIDAMNLLQMIGKRQLKVRLIGRTYAEGTCLAHRQSTNPVRVSSYMYDHIMNRLGSFVCEGHSDSMRQVIPNEQTSGDRESP